MNKSGVDRLYKSGHPWRPAAGIFEHRQATETISSIVAAMSLSIAQKLLAGSDWGHSALSVGHCSLGHKAVSICPIALLSPEIHH